MYENDIIHAKSTEGIYRNVKGKATFYVKAINGTRANVVTTEQNEFTNKL